MLRNINGGDQTVVVIEVQAFKSKLWPTFQGKKSMLIVVKIDYLNFFQNTFKIYMLRCACEKGCTLH